MVEQATYMLINCTKHLVSINIWLLSRTASYIKDVMHVTDGGCTESPATTRRTSPAPPGDVTAPVATPISQSYISVAWRAAGRPNGPNIRYELARMKLSQPLDSKFLTLTHH